MNKCCAPLILFSGAALATAAMAQSAIEHHAWQRKEALVPLSRTAVAITGPIRVSANSVSFGGKSVPAKNLGLFWRVWGDDGMQHTAAIYQLLADPGPLRQGNSLCGSSERDRARFIVLWESYDESSGGAVNMAAWSSETPPQDRDSAGLCATFAYVWKVR